MRPAALRLGIARAWCRLARDRRGVSAVEFALLAPALLGLIFGVIEMGRAAYTQGVVSFAAEEATRYAVVNYEISEEEVRDLTEDCLLGIDRSRIDAVVVTGPINPDDNTRTISVEVTYNFQFLLPFLPMDSVTISGSSRGFLIPPPLGTAPTVSGTAIGCGRG